DEDRAARVAQLPDDRAEAHAPQRVQAFGRLVQHDQLALSEQRLRQPEPLVEPARERPHLAVRVRAEPEALDQLVRASGSGPARDPLEPRQRAQRWPHPPLARQAEALRQVRGAVASRVAPRLEPAHADRPRRRVNEAQQQCEQRALARAVRPHHPPHAARRDLERDAGERIHSCLARAHWRAEALADLPELDHVPPPRHASCHAARALMQLLFPVRRRSRPPASRGSARDTFDRVLRFIDRHVRGYYTAVVLSILLAFLVGIAAVVLFVFLGDVVAAGATREIDEAVLRWAAERRTPALNGAMLEITALGSTLVLAIIAGTAAVFLWLTRHRFSVYILGFAFLAAGVLNVVLKALYDRPRPDMVPTVVTSQSPAFPSGHALSAFAIYGTLAYLVARLEPSPRLRAATWIIAALIILAVGASRVYLGVHHPSDVLAGFVIALAWIAFAAAAITALTYFARRRSR